MSLWRADRVELRIGGASPGGLEQGGARARVEAHVADFERQLEERQLRRGTRLSCVLGGDTVRYAIVPWHEEMSSPALRQRLAEQGFRQTYGEVARDWTVCQHGERYAAATLACAVDTALLDRIDAAAQARGLVLGSVQPALTHAFNQARRAMADSLFWFVSIESLGTTVLLMSSMEPLQVKRLSAPAAELVCALDREWFALGLEAERCPVYILRGATSDQVPCESAGKGWRFVHLSPLPSAAPRIAEVEAV